MSVDSMKSKGYQGQGIIPNRDKELVLNKNVIYLFNLKFERKIWGRSNIQRGEGKKKRRSLANIYPLRNYHNQYFYSLTHPYSALQYIHYYLAPFAYHYLWPHIITILSNPPCLPPITYTQACRKKAHLHFSCTFPQLSHVGQLPSRTNALSCKHGSM